MKVAIFGAGAIGGYVGAKLALAGKDVTLIARGAHLKAIQEHGLRLLEGESEVVAHPQAVIDGRDAGEQDYVIVTLKAHQIAPALPSLAPLLGPETAVVMAQNGVPFWYFYGLEGDRRDQQLESLDPGGVIWRTLGPERVIGCVVYPACEIVAPGVVRHIEDERFSLGEPDGSRSGRVTRLAQLMIEAGLRAPVRTRLRSEIWFKLWGNVAFNPVSALTRATLAEIGKDAGLRAFVRAVMVEVEAVAGALGEKMPLGVDARIDGAVAVGEHKTSMLQDLETGRPLELDAVCGAVVELAAMTGTAAPNLRALEAMTRLLAGNLGLLP